MRLYKNVLHHSANDLPKWLLEAIGVYVSLLNACDYCVDHHYQGMRRLIDDDDRARSMREALEAGRLDDAFDARERAALEYARRLTLEPSGLAADDLLNLRKEGLSDGEILEINQVAAYFAYANRTVLGLGGTTAGDVLGLSPGDSDDPENWHHA
jgi:uncharacterized peroxidase-related enzyme